MKRAIMIVLCLVTLSGCGTLYQAMVAQPTNLMPESIRQKCEPIPVELAHKAHAGNLMDAYDSLVGLYGECALRDRAKANWVGAQNQ